MRTFTLDPIERPGSACVDIGRGQTPPEEVSPFRSRTDSQHGSMMRIPRKAFPTRHVLTQTNGVWRYHFLSRINPIPPRRAILKRSSREHTLRRMLHIS